MGESTFKTGFSVHAKEPGIASKPDFEKLKKVITIELVGVA